MCEGYALAHAALSQIIMKGGLYMMHNETEIVVSEKNVPMKDDIRKQAKLCAKECLRASKGPLGKFAEVLIWRLIDLVIDAVC